MAASLSACLVLATAISDSNAVISASLAARASVRLVLAAAISASNTVIYASNAARRSILAAIAVAAVKMSASATSRLHASTSYSVSEHSLHPYARLAASRLHASTSYSVNERL